VFSRRGVVPEVRAVVLDWIWRTYYCFVPRALGSRWSGLDVVVMTDELVIVELY